MMTFSNGQWNPNPLANPFNTRVHGNVSLNSASASLMSRKFKMSRSPQNLQVPNLDVPLFGSPEWEKMQLKQQSLTVPNQDVPLGDLLKGSGFLGNSDRIFKCADGTLLDFKTGKILRTPKSEDGCWGSNNIDGGNDIYGFSKSGNEWSRDGETKLEDLLRMADNSKVGLMAVVDAEIDPLSAEYWLKAEEEASKLMNLMTSEQKAMIAAFEHHFPKSRLIEETMRSKKAQLQLVENRLLKISKIS